MPRGSVIAVAHTDETENDVNTTLTIPHSASPIEEEILDIIRAGLDHSDPKGWIPWAWSVLAREGDVPAVLCDDHGDEYARLLLTLAGLGRLYELFVEVHLGGYASGEIMTDLLHEGRPHMTVIELARYCEQRGIYDSDLPETESGLQNAAIEEHTDAVRRRLVEILGEWHLYTSLVHAATPEPLPDFSEDDVADEEELDDDSAIVPDGDVNSPTVEQEHQLVFDQIPLPFETAIVFDSSDGRSYEWLRGDLDLG